MAADLGALHAKRLTLFGVSNKLRTKEQRAAAIPRFAAEVLPLKHAIDLARPLMLGRIPDAILLHVAVLAAYAFAAYYVALALTRRRLLK